MKNSYTESLSHTTWECKYHIVFASKYRRKVFSIIYLTSCISKVGLFVITRTGLSYIFNLSLTLSTVIDVCLSAIIQCRGDTCNLD